LAAPASARCAPSDAACLTPAVTPVAATFTRADAMPVAQPVARRDAGAVPPAVVAAIVGLLALAMAFRPRSRGLPEVTS
ncbi:hypothetical protein, partial [Sandarakinorhabdus rubra]|uniref:hypothetical protein n=1 Tax=Sandarakinorhabdus rubra TaxID=2672568 RepID=UPI001969B4A0